MDLSPIAATAFARLLEARTGQQLSAGRRWRLETALGPVMRAHGMDTLDAVAVQIGRDRHSPLAREVVEALLNHETSFFRDMGSFRLLVEEGLAAVAARRAESRQLRIWSAGCSTGQEPVSLALALRRQASRWQGWTISILATDISFAAIERARAGVFTHFQIQRGLPVADMLGGFEPLGDDWCVKPEIRHAIEFRQHNLLDPMPSGPFDVILCRNVLFYLSPERRRTVLDALGEVSAPDAVLMLGAGETVLGQTGAFYPDPVLKGLYRRERRRQPRPEPEGAGGAAT